MPERKENSIAGQAAAVLGGPRKSRRARSRRRSFRPRRRSVAAARGGPDAACQSALRNGVHQDQGTHLRRRPQAVAAEGHGTRARRIDAIAAMASRRNDLRPAAARLFVQDAEKGVARRALHRDFRSRQKRQAVCRRVARSVRAENQSRQSRARQARPRARADSAGRRRRQIFSRRAQPRRAQGARAGRA